jgi:hypothetical protein
VPNASSLILTIFTTGSCTADRFCICIRHPTCHHNLLGYIGWPLQSLCDYQLRRLQRFPSTQSRQVRGLTPGKRAELMHCGLVRYIVAQIFGGYIACLLIYAQYKDLINVSENGTRSRMLHSPMSKVGGRGFSSERRPGGYPVYTQRHRWYPGVVHATRSEPGSNTFE